MADTKLSALTELAATPADNDEVYIRDESETPANESKRITIANLLAGAGAATKEFFVGLNETVSTEILLTGARLNAAGETAAFKGFHIPHDFTTLVEAVVRLRPFATATMRFDLLGSYQAIGESEATHNETSNDVDLVCTSNEEIELNVAGVLANLSAGDVGYVRVKGDATTNIPDCLIYLLRIKYT